MDNNSDFKNYEYRSKFKATQVGSIVISNHPISINNTIKDVKEFFELEKSLNSLVVEDESGNIIGLIHKSSLLYIKPSLFTFFKNRIETLISFDSMIVDSKEYIGHLINKIIKRNANDFFEDFIIYDYNNYLGIGTIIELFLKMNELRNNSLSLAKEIQSKLIKNNYKVKLPFDVYSYIETSRELGGDLFQYLNTKKNKYLISIFDVTGKDVSGSLITGVLSSYFSSLKNLLDEINEINLVKSLDRVCYEETTRFIFVSSILIFIDVEKQELSFYNFGLCPIILMFPENKEDEKIFVVPFKTSPLGIAPNRNQKDINKGHRKIKIRKDLKVLLFTDGVSEAQNKEGELFGIYRLIKILRKNIDKEDIELLDIIKNEISNFIYNNFFNDDVTILLLNFQKLFNKLDF